METVNIHQAKTHFSRLLSRVELGEEIIISNRGIPVAKLVPFHVSSNRRDSLGLDRERFIVPEDFDAPLPEKIFSRNVRCHQANDRPSFIAPSVQNINQH